MTGWLELIALLAAAAGGGWWWWKTHPEGRCWYCKGTGRNPLSTKHRRGPCKHCGGAGWNDKRKKKDGTAR